MWINGQEGTTAPLDDFAVQVMPNSDGQIEILVTATSPRNSAALGGVAIREAERLPILVNMSGDEDDNNPFNGQTTLREALAIANSRTGADEIIFDNTVFGVPSTLTLASGELRITDSVSIIGPGANQLTIDAGGGSRHFQINDNSSALIDVTLANLTLRRGNNQGSGSGGAIQSSENVTILNSVISGNTTTGANFGGGIFHSAGLMTIRNSTLSGNTSYSGGAIINYPGTGMVIENTTISGNRTNVYAGGAIFNQAPLTIRNSTITNNISDHSAGIFSRYINSSQLVIQNSIVAGNRTSNDTPSDLRGTVPTITHSLVGSNNLSGLTPAATADTNGNLIGSAAPIDPLLGPLALNGGTTQTHALLADSPAIDAGNNTLVTGQTADQRGTPFVRVANNTVDMGAFERQTLAADSFVVTTLTDELDYSNESVSLREAINSANGSVGSNTITFAPTLSGSILLTQGELPITDSVTITGPGAAGDLVIDAQMNSRVIYVASNGGAVTLFSLTLTNGKAPTGGDGGAILSGANQTLTILNSVIRDSVADVLGGGVRTAAAAISITNSSILNNQSMNSRGGGVDGHSGVVVTNSTVSGNRSATGGGGLSSGGDITVTNSTVSGNSTTRDFASGGGIRTSSGAVTLTGSTLSGNQVTGANSDGGGLWVDNAVVTIVNSTITGNSATRDGGGLGMLVNRFDRILTIRNTIVADNTAAANPDFTAPNAPGTNLEVRHSLIGNNTGTPLAASATADANGNLIGTNGAVIDPKLGPLAFNGGTTQTHALLADSPAINTGNNALIVSQTADQRGAPFDRIANNTIDMGAYERQTLAADSFVVTTLTDELDYRNDSVSLREAINSANGSIGADTITFSADLFTGGPGAIELTLGELQISDTVTITGPGQNLLAIDANQQSRVVTVIGGTEIDVTLEGLTITGGRTTGDNQFPNNTHSGGGIRFDSTGTLTLTGSTVSGNSTAGDRADGGGIHTFYGAVTLTGSTVSGNSTAGDRAKGGGIFTITDAVTLTGSTVAGNSTTGDDADGGGIFAFYGAVTLTSSIVSGNSTVGDRAEGGGIFTRTGAVTLTGSTVAGNSTTGDDADGGGIYAFFSSVVTLTDSTISGNSTEGRRADGGGIATYDSAVTLTGSTVSGNSTAGERAYGGGISSSAGAVTLTGSTISGNSTAGDNAHGGGLMTHRGSVTLTNSTLSGNSSTGRGGGVSIDPRAFSADASLTSHNSIIAGNTDAGGPDSAPDFLSPTLPANLNVRSSLIGDNTGTTLTAAATADPNANLIGTSTDPIDPLLGPLTLNGGTTQTHALLANSPAIDTGDNALVPAGIETDQRGRGFARILGNRVDIGAFEQRAITSTNLVASVNPAIFGQPITFTATVSTTETPDVPTGTVTFTVDGVSQPPVSLANGRSTFTTNSLGVGSHSIVVVYSGNSTLLPSTSATVSINVVGASDFGDAPDPYPVALANNGARHTIGDLFLGASVDAEVDGTPSVNADSDDGDDGVFVISTFITTNVATTSSFSVTASQAGKLDAWIDFNRDGDWSDAGEQIFNSVDVMAGENLLSFTIPAGATNGRTGARFRLSSAGGLAPTGAAADGEVEDYIAEIVSGSATAVLSIDVPGGIMNVVVQGGDLVARQGTTVLSRVPLARFGELNLNGSSLDDVLQLTILEAVTTKTLLIDGGLGKDFLELVESGQTIDLTNASITVREIEGIDITGTGDNTLVISIDSVKAVSSTTDTLQVISDAGDTINFGDGWRAEQPRFIDGQFTHVISEAAAGGTARVEVQNGRFFQNPLSAFDVDRSGRIEPLDALNVLIALQQLRQLGMSDLRIPTNDAEITTLYPDVSGDNQLVPLDALLVLIAISRINRGEAPEGELLAPPMDDSSLQLTQASERELVDIAIMEFESIDRIATFGLAGQPRVPEFDIDDWMQKLGAENFVEGSEQSSGLVSKVAVRFP